jgi:serine/threonine protein kinase
MGCTGSHSEPVWPEGGKSKSNGGGGFHDTYFVGKKLCSGSVSQVHVATRVKIGQNSNGDEAVKIMDLRLAGPKLHKMIGTEVSHWKTLSSDEHCVKLNDVWYGNGMCYMVMERCNGTLLQYLDGTFEYDERFLGGVFLQMLLGIKAVHARDIVHRDIKPLNFMVGGEDGSQIKIGDFSLSASMPSTSKLRGECGSAPFMSPEMVSGSGYDFKTDIWSFGVIVYALLFGRYPYPAEELNHRSFKQATELAEGAPSFKSSLELSCNVIAFSMSLLKRQPNIRTSAADALNMSFMVASCKREHGIGVDLPDLVVARQHAKKLYAFQASDDDGGVSHIDTYLNKLQMDKFRVPIQAVPSNGSALPNRFTIARTKSIGSTHSKGSRGTSKKRNSRCARQFALDDAETSTAVGDSSMLDGSWTCNV